MVPSQKYLTHLLITGSLSAFDLEVDSSMFNLVVQEIRPRKPRTQGKKHQIAQKDSPGWRVNSTGSP